MSQSSTYNNGGGGGGGVITIDGDIGSVTGATISFNAEPTSGSSVTFSGTGTTMRFNVTDLNVNTIIGNNAGNGTISGTHNTSVGASGLLSVTSGSYNIGLGIQALEFITSGSYNIGLGSLSGSSYTSSESSNILLNNAGTLGESNVLRIGSGTGAGNQQISNAYISGINGVNVGSVASVVSVNGDHLGSTTITAGSGITVTPGANTVTISASGSGFSWNDVISGSATLAASNGYVIHNAGATTLTLPTNSALGDTIQIVGRQGIWAIIYNTGQYIQFGNVSTTPTSGQLSATDAHDCVTLVCTIPSGTSPVFTVTNSVGNITVA